MKAEPMFILSAPIWAVAAALAPSGIWSWAAGIVSFLTLALFLVRDFTHWQGRSS